VRFGDRVWCVRLDLDKVAIVITLAPTYTEPPITLGMEKNSTQQSNHTDPVPLNKM
jgi:hypothetical protein